MAAAFGLSAYKGQAFHLNGRSTMNVVDASSDKCVLMFFLISVQAAGPTERPELRPANDFQSVIHHFDYDSRQLLDVHDKNIEEFSDGVLHDTTYTSLKGGPVAAYLVVPKGKGPFAAVFFGRCGNGTRAEFIPEARTTGGCG